MLGLVLVEYSFTYYTNIKSINKTGRRGNGSDYMAILDEDTSLVNTSPGYGGIHIYK